MDVPEIRRQFGEFALHIDACPIPCDQGLSRESMPEVVNARPMSVASLWVGGRNPIVRDTAAKVYRVFHSVMRVRRSATKKAGVDGLGMIRSLASLYARN